MKIEDALKNVGLLGLDTAPFVYFVERNPSYPDLMRDVFRRITNGKLTACSSVITLTETLVQPLHLNNKNLTDDYRELLLNGINFQLLDINPEIAETAAELRAKYNLRTPDALQIAAAMENGCDAFLCNDKDLRRVNEIKNLVLDELSL